MGADPGAGVGVDTGAGTGRRSDVRWCLAPWRRRQLRAGAASLSRKRRRTSPMKDEPVAASMKACVLHATEATAAYKCILNARKIMHQASGTNETERRKAPATVSGAGARSRQTPQVQAVRSERRTVRPSRSFTMAPPHAFARFEASPSLRRDRGQSVRSAGPERCHSRAACRGPCSRAGRRREAREFQLGPATWAGPWADEIRRRIILIDQTATADACASAVV